MIPRWRRVAASPYVTVALAAILIAALIRAFVGGVAKYVGLPVNIEENFGPLFRLILEAQPIEQLGPRQYGAVAFLVVDPVIRAVGIDALVLNVWMLIIGLVGIGVAFALFVRRYGIVTLRGRMLLGLVWAGFLPLIDAMANRLFDLPVLGLIAAALFMYTGAPRVRRWAGAAIGLAFMTKLLPAIFLPLLMIRERLAFAYGLLAIVASLLLAQVLYGTAMGIGYPLYLLTSTPETTYKFSFQGENNSLRGLVFKVAVGFRTAPAGQTATPPDPMTIHYVVLAASVLLVAYMLYASFRSGDRQDLERRSIEMALAIVTMYLVAPLATHEHMVALILVYSILAWLWTSTPAPRPPVVIAMAVVSVLLIGVYAPISLVARALDIDGLMRRLGNEGSEFFGSPIAGYNFLGFPGLGLILLWVVMVILEVRTRKA